MPELSPFQVLLVETKDAWIAQGLQYDISVEADSLQDVMYEFERALVGHVFISHHLGVEPFENLPAAPHECWEAWKSADRADFQTGASYRKVPGSTMQPPPKEMRYISRVHH